MAARIRIDTGKQFPAWPWLLVRIRRFMQCGGKAGRTYRFEQVIKGVDLKRLHGILVVCRHKNKRRRIG